MHVRTTILLRLMPHASALLSPLASGSPTTSLPSCPILKLIHRCPLTRNHPDIGNLTRRREASLSPHCGAADRDTVHETCDCSISFHHANLFK
ncbi:hypothetical protein BV20DRAFT_196573 [Pilatotrama ljubarskyi]|nr:hypothetical protein BV20DRAFT_196573 [Pilatotrama ljubarskyi]